LRAAELLHKQQEEAAPAEKAQQQQKTEWDAKEKTLVQFSPEWYRFKAETYRVQAEWNPNSAWLYNQFVVDNLKRAQEKEQKILDDENERNRNEAQKQAQKEKAARQSQQQQDWDAEESNYESGSPAWYRFQAGISEAKAKWYGASSPMYKFFMNYQAYYLQQAEKPQKREEDEQRRNEQRQRDYARQQQEREDSYTSDDDTYVPPPNNNNIVDNAKILELNATSLDQLTWSCKKTYKKLALKWHPDKNTEPGAEAKIKLIGNAYTYFKTLHDTGQLKD
jgi:hypothetical protein